MKKKRECIPIAKTWGGRTPSDFPWYLEIVADEYKFFISKYGLTAMSMLATYVWKKQYHFFTDSSKLS